MDVKLLNKILRTMRDQGCLRLKTPELELELTPEALLSRESEPSGPDSTEPVPPYPSQEELDRLVFYSAPPAKEE